MPRQCRDDRAGQIDHALNRGNQRQEIFHKPEDDEAFIRVLAETLQKYPLEWFSFTLMPNHWHLVLRPAKDGQMGRLLRWVTATHTLRYRGQYHSRSGRHLYQGRFKSFPIDDDEHFHVVCRYVQRNPLRAKLVSSAMDWPHEWTGLTNGLASRMDWPHEWTGLTVRSIAGTSQKNLIRSCFPRGNPSIPWLESTGR